MGCNSSKSATENNRSAADVGQTRSNSHGEPPGSTKASHPIPTTPPEGEQRETEEGEGENQGGRRGEEGEGEEHQGGRRGEGEGEENQGGRRGEEEGEENQGGRRGEEGEGEEHQGGRRGEGEGEHQGGRRGEEGEGEEHQGGRRGEEGEGEEHQGGRRGEEGDGTGEEEKGERGEGAGNEVTRPVPTTPPEGEQKSAGEEEAGEENQGRCWGGEGGDGIGDEEEGEWGVGARGKEQGEDTGADERFGERELSGETTVQDAAQYVDRDPQPRKPKTSTSKYRDQEPDGESEASADVISLLLAGDVTVDCPPSDKVVRLFLSSTFTDTSNERNTLMERVFPGLRDWCQGRGYHFQVVDMRWGVRDEATDDHLTTSLCLREVDTCNRISTGPCFVTFLSHKYGYRPLPTVLQTTEFDSILAAISDEDAQQLLTKWFRKDDNAVLPSYVLQPISSLLPDFLSNDTELRAKAASQWWDESAAMQASIGQAAVTCLSKERAHELTQSVTEAEIRRGLLTEDGSLLKRGVWMYRHIEDIDTVEPSGLSGRFKDVGGDEAMQKESRSLLDSLKTELLSRLPPDRLLRYTVRWDAEKGISPEKDLTHKEYIDNFCNDFEKQMKQLAQEAITAREQDHRVTPLVEEVTHHTRFCQEKCRHFHGRHGALERTMAYLQGTDKSRGRVFVIHGRSGSGKTSIVAMAARQACQLHQGKGVVVVRFLGTSPDSTAVVGLLRSILRQLFAARSRSAGHELPSNVKELGQLLQRTLMIVASEEFPVTLLLDSLDQMDPGHDARQLTWLPDHLPDHVRVIVSTLPEPQYEAFPKLQSLYEGDTSNFYEIPTLEDGDVRGILDQWLASAQRRLTANQRERVMEAFGLCRLPLFLKLSFDVASKWNSYSAPDTTVLQSTVRESINVVFAEVERLHGRLLVSHALACLTLSRSGLTEAELEDILSCDDDVLNDVYMYWTPPVRRLPPLLLVRLKADLGQYLIDRAADGVGVFFWYHRQFTEAAHDRYCSDVTRRATCHRALADYFCGLWSGGKPKPYTDKKGNSSEADRVVSSQPLKVGDSFNLRKLNNLPFHALRAVNLEQLKTECLLNFRFLQAKVLACGIRAVLDDFSAASKVMEGKEGEEEVKVVAQTLQLSQDALEYDPLQLPAQLLSRVVSPSQGLKPFLEQCRTGSDAPFLLPNQPIMVAPGGQLLHSLNEHTGHVSAMAMTSDGKFVVTYSSDTSLCVTDVAEGRTVRTVDGALDEAEVPFTEKCQRLVLCADDTVIVLENLFLLAAFEFSTGNRLWSLNTVRGGVALVGLGMSFHNASVAFSGPGLSTVMFFRDRTTVILIDAGTGTQLETAVLPPSAEHFFCRPMAGHEKYVALMNAHQNQLLLMDTQENAIHVSPRMERQILFPPNQQDDSGSEEDAVKFVDLVVSPDGRYIYCANATDRDLHVLEIPSFTVVKVFKGEGGDFLEKIHLTPDGRYLYTFNERDLRVFDLRDNREGRTSLPVNSLHDVTTTDMRIVVTLAENGQIRVWDFERTPSDGKSRSLELKDMFAKTRREIMEGTATDELGKTAEEPTEKRKTLEIWKMMTLSSPRYLLVVSMTKEKHFYLQVYDLAMETYVRRAPMGQNVAVPFYPLERTHILTCVWKRFKVLDVDSMAVVRSFQGHVGRRCYDCTHLVDEGKAVLTLTRGGRHLKVYSVGTGKVVAVIRQTRPSSINSVVVNEKSTTAVAQTDAGHLSVFDLRQRLQTYSIVPGDLGLASLTLRRDAVTSEGRFLLVEGHKESPEGLTSLLVFDLEEGQTCHDLTHTESFRKSLLDPENDFKASLTSLCVLDSETLLSAHHDGHLRLFNIQTGELQRTMDSRQSQPRLVTTPSSRVVVTRGTNAFNMFRLSLTGQSADHQNAFILRSKDDLRALASFFTDDRILDFVLLPDRCSPVVASAKDSEDPVLFHLCCPDNVPLPGNRTPLTSYPEIYEGKELSHVIEDLGIDEGVDDANDLDDDDGDPEW